MVERASGTRPSGSVREPEVGPLAQRQRKQSAGPCTRSGPRRGGHVRRPDKCGSRWMGGLRGTRVAVSHRRQ